MDVSLFSVLFSDEKDELIYSHRILHQRIDLFDYINFKIRFRLTKRSAMEILTDIELSNRLLTWMSDDRNSAVSPVYQLLLSLR